MVSMCVSQCVCDMTVHPQHRFLPHLSKYTFVHSVEARMTPFLHLKSLHVDTD